MREARRHERYVRVCAVRRFIPYCMCARLRAMCLMARRFCATVRVRAHGRCRSRTEGSAAFDAPVTLLMLPMLRALRLQRDARAAPRRAACV